jgi:hypothetical protein
VYKYNFWASFEKKLHAFWVIRTTLYAVLSQKFGDLLLAAWHTLEICGFAVCGLKIKNLRI